MSECVVPMPAVEKPPITAIAPWFGSKRGLGDRIVEQLGPHNYFLDPMCGSMSILFAKPPSSIETVCDLHGDLTNLAMVLASDACAVLYDRLARTLDAEEIFRAAKRRVEEDWEDVPADPGAVGAAHVERAYWYFLAAWAGRNGCAGTRRVNYQMAVRWTNRGGSGATRLASAIDSVPWFHTRLRGVLILHRSVFDVLPKIEDAAGVAIYADPPYLMHTRSMGRKALRGSGSHYLHDFTPADHARLAAELRRFRKARVVVSYYADPLLADLYPGWTQVDCTMNKNLHVQNRKGSTKCDAPEVLLLNGPSYAAGDMKESGLFP